MGSAGERAERLSQRAVRGQRRRARDRGGRLHPRPGLVRAGARHRRPGIGAGAHQRGRRGHPVPDVQPGAGGHAAERHHRAHHPGVTHLRSRAARARRRQPGPQHRRASGGGTAAPRRAARGRHRRGAAGGGRPRPRLLAEGTDLLAGDGAQQVHRDRPLRRASVGDHRLAQHGPEGVRQERRQPGADRRPAQAGRGLRGLHHGRLQPVPLALLPASGRNRRSWPQPPPPRMRHPPGPGWSTTTAGRAATSNLGRSSASWRSGCRRRPDAGG